MAQVNTADVSSYGADPWTERATAALSAAFGARGGAYFVVTGTAANVLGLSLLLRPFEGVICAESAHVNVDECGAPERILGSKLLTVPTTDGKLTPELIGTRLTGRGDEHRAQPRAVTISQVTELGTCYSLAELKSLAEFCPAQGLRLYLNGAGGAEAVVVMAEELAADVPFLRKQQGQLVSKMRYLAAQFEALLDGDLWLGNARRANAMAQRLAEGVTGVPGVTLWQPVESNAVFAALNPAHIARLHQDWHFYVWDSNAHVVRWMTAFDTTEADVDAFVADIRRTA